MSEQALDFHLQMADDHEQQLFERQQESNTMNINTWYILRRDEDYKIEHCPEGDPTYGQASWSTVGVWNTRLEAEYVLTILIEERERR